MENPLSLRLIKEEQESSEKLLELLVSSTHSPKGRFSKENSYIMLKRKIETTKNGNSKTGCQRKAKESIGFQRESGQSFRSCRY